MNHCLATLGATAMFCAPSVAQSHHVAWSRIETGVWTMHPIYSEGADGVIATDNLLSLADPGSLVGDNIVAVWCRRGAGGWTTKSWETSDPWEAVKFVKQELEIPDSEDERWNLGGSGAGNLNAVVPKDFAGGVLADDPLAALIASSPDRDAIVDILVGVGYKAAALPVERGDECTTAEKLDSLASEATRMVASGDHAVLTLGATDVTCEVLTGIPRGPAPVKPAQPATPPVWSPPGTVPTAPSWIPGGWPAAPGWGCRTVPIFGGGTNCICSRIQRWGRWESTTCRFLFWTWTCVKWHEIWELETCTNIDTACPSGGPPAAGSSCSSSY